LVRNTHCTGSYLIYHYSRIGYRIIACYSLPPGATAFTNSYFGIGFRPQFLRAISCLGIERSLLNCSHTLLGSTSVCNATNEVGVRCIGTFRLHMSGLAPLLYLGVSVGSVYSLDWTTGLTQNGVNAFSSIFQCKREANHVHSAYFFAKFAPLAY